MFKQLQRIPRDAWVLLSLVAIISVATVYVRVTGVVDSRTILYVVQPVSAALLAIVAYAIAGGRTDRIRHKSEKAVIVGSIIAIWFVIYFMSGLLTTYVRNTLVADLQGVLLNIIVFGGTAAAIEYARHVTMVVGGRRTLLSLGLMVAMVFSISQMTLENIVNVNAADDVVKAIVANVIPAIFASLLLTYLAVSSGLPAMLTYRLGVVAATILPPIIPKYDWYLLGVSSIVLTIAVYIAIDRNAQGRQFRRRSRRHHPRRAYDVMLLIVMVCLVLFMTGAFTYKPTVILSNSMHPVFSRGSMVVVQKVEDPMDVKKGDIVQYRSEDRTITHRVVAIELAEDGSGERRYTTKGDNSPSNDPVVYPKQILGIVRSQVPYIGYPTVWLHELAL